MSTSQPPAVLRSCDAFPAVVEAECTRQVHPGRMTSEEVPLLGAPQFHSPLTSCRKQPQLCKRVCAQGEDMCAFLSNRMKSWVCTLWPALTNLSLIVGVEVQEV